MSIEETYFSIKTMCLSAQLTDSAVKRWNISSKIRNRIRMVTFALLFNTILKILVTAIRESSKKNLNWKSCLIHLKVKVTQSFPTLCDPMDHGILWARIQGFPHSSVGKEYSCIAGEPGLIPGLGRYAGEGIGYPLQFSWASLVAQLIKNLLAMWYTWVWSLGCEDHLEKATHSSILAWRIPWTVQSMGSDMTELLSLSLQIGN